MSDLTVTKDETTELILQHSVQKIVKNQDVIIAAMSDKQKEVYEMVNAEMNLLVAEVKFSKDPNKIENFVAGIESVYEHVKREISEGHAFFAEQFKEHENDRRRRKIFGALMALFVIGVAIKNVQLNDTLISKALWGWWYGETKQKTSFWAAAIASAQNYAILAWTSVRTTYDQAMFAIFVLLVAVVLKLNDIEHVESRLLGSIKFRQSSNKPNAILHFLSAMVLANMCAECKLPLLSFAVLMYGIYVAFNYTSESNTKAAEALTDLSLKRKDAIETSLKPIRKLVKKMLKNDNSHEHTGLSPHNQVKTISERQHNLSVLTNVFNSLLPLAKPCAVSALDKDMPVATCISEMSRARLQQTAVLTPLQQLM